MTPAPPVPEQVVTLALADGEMHELVFTDREARPAKWETRCRRTDVPLERAGSAGPGMHYPVTCGACLRIAGLEAALKRFEHLEESAVAEAVRRGIGQAVADERKRIAELSREMGASYAVDPEAGVSVLREFADLIEAER